MVQEQGLVQGQCVVQLQCGALRKRRRGDAAGAGADAPDAKQRAEMRAAGHCEAAPDGGRLRTLTQMALFHRTRRMRSSNSLRFFNLYSASSSGSDICAEGGVADVTKRHKGTNFYLFFSARMPKAMRTKVGACLLFGRPVFLLLTFLRLAYNLLRCDLWQRKRSKNSEQAI